MDLIAASLPERTSAPNQFQTICNRRVRQALITFQDSTLTADLHKTVSAIIFMSIEVMHSLLQKNNSNINDHLADIVYI